MKPATYSEGDAAMTRCPSQRARGGCAADDEQPWIDYWPLFEEALSKFPVLADIESARVRLARKFNRRLPKEIETDLAWQQHARARLKSTR